VPKARNRRRVRPARWSIAAAVMLLLGFGAGCDWFDEPLEVNLIPTVRITGCPGAGELVEGDDATLEWMGVDLDGEITRYEWSFDDSTGTTTLTSATFTDIAGGDHEFVVTAFDDGGAESDPDTCAFSVGSTGGLVERSVLCELLTTKPCVNCWKAELALLRMVQDLGADRVAVVAYHFHPPPVDPVGTAETMARCNWYYTYPNFGGLSGTFPVTIFDGLDYEDDAPDTTSTKIAFRSRIEDRLAVDSPVSIAMAGDVSSRGNVTVTVRVHEQLTGGPRFLRMVVVEDEVFDGEEYFEFVARDILDEEELTVSAVGDSAVVTRNFSIGTWDPQHLDVIAFVQDDSSAEIIQSARLSTQ